MPETTSNVEFAQKIQELAHDHRPPAGRHVQWVEILEAVLLATVAVATAWSGYQAARWDALSSQHYNLAASTTVLSQAKQTLAGQDRLYDITTFDAWLSAKSTGRDELAALYERRFRPEYATAFAAWWKLDPLRNPGAPPGPIFMSEYTNANAQQAAVFADEAKQQFEKGVSTRETGDAYVRITVFFATVLLLTALSQRFEIFGPRLAVLAFALALLVMSTFWILTFPRA